MSEITYATIETTQPRFRRLVEQATLHGDAEYGKAYLNMQDGVVALLGGTAGGEVGSYMTATESYLDDVTLGDDLDAEAGAEAIIDIDTFLFYLDLVGGEDGILIEFKGEADGRLADTVEMAGELNNRIYLPNSENTLEAIPTFLAGRFDENDLFQPSGDRPPLDTEIETTAEVIGNIIVAVDNDQISGVEHFPISVSDEELHIEVGDENTRNSVWGTLNADAVSGPDVGNTYGDAFKHVFDALSGSVRLNTTTTDDGPAPLSVVQHPFEGVTFRYLIGPNGTL